MNPIVYIVLVALIATAIVFLVLIALWRIFNMMKSLFGGKKKQNAQDTNTRKLDTAAVEITSANTAAIEMDENELVAVITAAINACMGSQSNLFIRKIIRVGDSTPVWSQLGRHEQTLNRL
jgi:Na+-transporting methylmalonyl-CoA/oxaloacetate decarboxylase gamma subunit